MVILGSDRSTQQSVTLPDESRLHGLYIIGRNGMGKSTLFANLIAQDLDNGNGLALLDPHGDLTDDVLCLIPEHRHDDILLWDVGDAAHPVGLNLFDCPVDDPLERARTAENVVQVFKRIWGIGEDASWGPRVEDLLRNTAFVFVANPGTTLVEVPRFLTDPAFRQQLVGRVSNPIVAGYFATEYPKDERTQREWRSPLLNKVRSFLINPLLYHIVGQSKTTLDFRQIMDQGKVLLVKLALGKLDDSAVALLGSILVGQILSASQTRQDTPRGSRKPFYLFCDEYQRFQTPTFSTLIDEARKYAVATTIAHQWRGQLSGSFRNAPLGAVNTVVFQVIAPDAEELAGVFDATPPEPEITGTRSKMVVTSQPIEFIREHGHPDPLVREFIERFPEETEDFYHADPRAKPRRALYPNQNRFLSSVMHGETPDSVAFVKSLAGAPCPPDGSNPYIRGRSISIEQALIEAFGLSFNTGRSSSKEVQERDSAIVLSWRRRVAPWYGYNPEINLYPAKITGFPEFPPYLKKRQSVAGLEEEQTPSLEMLRWTTVSRYFELFRQKFADRLPDSRGELESVRAQWESEARIWFSFPPNYARRAWEAFYNSEDDTGKWEILAFFYEMRFGRDMRPHWDPFEERDHPERLEPINQTYRSMVHDRKKIRAERDKIFRVLDCLRATPLMVTSGEQEPIYGLARTFADMRGEIANELGNLPKLAARYRILEDRDVAEGMISIGFPDIREPFVPQTNTTFARDIRDVEQEIAARTQLGVSTSTPNPPGKTIPDEPPSPPRPKRVPRGRPIE